MVELNAETDFVANGEEFKALAAKVAAIVAEQNPTDMDALLACKKDGMTVEAMVQELRRHFRPEFLNRIDETLIFHSLKREDIRKIVALQMDILAKRLAEQEVSLTVTDAALDLIAECGYDPDFGARPLKRAIISMVETPLSRKMISGTVVAGNKLVIDAEHETLNFDVQQ